MLERREVRPGPWPLFECSEFIEALRSSGGVDGRDSRPEGLLEGPRWPGEREVRREGGFSGREASERRRDPPFVWRSAEGVCSDSWLSDCVRPLSSSLGGVVEAPTLAVWLDRRRGGTEAAVVEAMMLCAARRGVSGVNGSGPRGRWTGRNSLVCGVICRLEAPTDRKQDCLCVEGGCGGVPDVVVVPNFRVDGTPGGVACVVVVACPGLHGGGRQMIFLHAARSFKKEKKMSTFFSCTFLCL